MISSSANKKILLTSRNVRMDSGHYATKYYCNTSNVQNSFILRQLIAVSSNALFFTVKLDLEILSKKRENSLQIQYEKTVLLLLSSRPVK